METRIEHDSMGDVEVPADALWQAQTQRAVTNTGRIAGPVDPAIVRALARIKAAAARANGLPQVADAAQQVIDGLHEDQFPVDVFQTGSGTSTNMNLNEVIGTLARAHPNDEVNKGQSSNDTFPSALHLAAAEQAELLKAALTHLSETLQAKAAEHRDTVKAGRTHLMDATPVTFGQELGGWAAQAAYGVERLDAVLPRVLELPLGGTAVGTGLNSSQAFTDAVLADLRKQTGLALTEARDHFEAQGARDALVELSGAARTIAVGLNKVAMDLRLLSSGPMTGLAEVHLPDLQPGSSIMPGKVNPVVPEIVHQVVAQVVGNDAAVAWAGAMGTLELNVMLPVIGRNLVESLRLLTAAADLLADRAIAGLTVDAERMRRYAESSPSIVTPLNRYLGYEEAAKVVKEALRSGRTIREVAQQHVELGRLTPSQLDEALDVLRMTVRPSGDAPAG